MRFYSWLVLLMAGCNGILPPPPPPKTRTAPPLADTAKPEDLSKKSSAPRTENSAPEHFKVQFETSKGNFVVDVHRHWAPLAADRFYQLVKEGYYDGNKFFRVAQNPAIVQFGLNGDPKVTAKYLDQGIPDEARTQSNSRGTLAFAKSAQPNSRTMQLFINRGDNSAALDSQGFAPFGRIVENLKEVVDDINSEYGETPEQGTIMQVGNIYLDERFPNLDYIVKAHVMGDDTQPAADGPGDSKNNANEKTTDAPESPAETKEGEAAGGQ